MHMRISLILVPLVLGACAGMRDSDEDGLSDKEEAELGTDPEVADTDGDGLDDFRESQLGTDGTEWDSDGDGYGDFDEDQAGSDPTDAEDVIYAGGWPYNADKDGIDGVALSERIRVNDVGGRFIGFDQFGEEVDLYDFAGGGVPIILDTSAVDCGPCQGMAMWLADDLDGSQLGFPDSFDIIPEAVESGDLYWVTVMYKSYQTGEPGGERQVENWVEDFPHDRIPVLTTSQDGSETDFDGDDGVDYATDWQVHVNLTFFPFLTLFDENLVLLKNSSSRSGYSKPLEVLVDEYL